MRANFGLAVLLIAAFILLIVGIVKALQWIYRRPWDQSGIVVRTLQLMLKIMFRPAEGFWELKVEKGQSVSWGHPHAPGFCCARL